jgi:hypothetical protein
MLGGYAWRCTAMAVAKNAVLNFAESEISLQF